MKKAIVGKKIGMTQIFTEDGRLVPVTVIKAGPCTVVQTKTVESDGYNAVQVGFGELTEKRAEKLLSKPVQGHYKKAGVEAKRVLREFRFDDCSGYKVMASPARWPAGISTPALWRTAPSIIAASAPCPLTPILPACSRTSTWAAITAWIV